MKTCKHRSCNNEVKGRKHYCSERCQYWENQLRKAEEKGLMPKNKRTNKYFWAYSGSSYTKGQGKRIGGGMIVGGLTGIPVPNFCIKEVTDENLKEHFSNYGIYKADLGNGSVLYRKDYEKLDT